MGAVVKPPTRGQGRPGWARGVGGREVPQGLGGEEGGAEGPRAGLESAKPARALVLEGPTPCGPQVAE